MAKTKLTGVLNNRLYQLLFLVVIASLCLYTMVYFSIIRPKLALLKNQNNTTQQAEANSTQPNTKAPASPTPENKPTNTNQSSGTVTQNSNTPSNSSSVKNGCGTPYETGYSTKWQYDPNRLTTSPEIITGGVNGKSVYCWENGSLVNKVLSSPVDKVVIRGTATATVPATPPPTQPYYSYSEAYSLSVSFCNSIGATSNTSAHQPCVSAKLKTFGY